MAFQHINPLYISANNSANGQFLTSNGSVAVWTYANSIPINANVSSSVQITVSTTTPTEIANVNITTSGGKVFVIGSGDMNPLSTGVWNYIRIYRDGSQVGHYQIDNAVNNSQNQGFAICHIDNPAAGPHLYQLMAHQGSGSAQYGEEGNSQAPAIVAIELLP